MRGRVLIAVALGLIGLVWIGQGMGLFPETGFMDDDRRWAAAGVALLVVGAVLAVSVWRARRRA